jgi:hypothetical protein
MGCANECEFKHLTAYFLGLPFRVHRISRNLAIRRAIGTVVKAGIRLAHQGGSDAEV